MATRSQNQDILGHPGAIRMILLHRWFCNFSPTLPKMGTSGKAYGSRSSQGRLSVTTPQARGSGTSEANCGSLLLNLVANRSTKSWCHKEHIASKTSGWRDHSVWMVRPSLDSLSAITFSWRGMCRALSHHVRILNRRAHREPDFIPLSLFI